MSLDRREFLRTVAVLLGGAVTTSCTSAVLARDPEAPPVAIPEAVLAADERRVLEAAMDRILPETSTPGALAVGAPEFVEFVLAEGHTPAERERFRAGLARLDETARARHGEGFDAIAPTARDEILREVEMEELAAAPPGAPAIFGSYVEKPFFGMLKELTLVGFFTSKVGATQVQRFDVWPGRFDGCVPVEPGQPPRFPGL